MDYKFNTLAVSLDGGVLEVVLNRPESRNAINQEMEHEIDKALDQAEVDPDVRAVLLLGEGPIFSAGHDLKEFFSDPKFRNTHFPAASPSKGPELPRPWYFRKPLIAGIHAYLGPAAVSIVACADFIIAEEGTRFSFEIFRGGGAAPSMYWMHLYAQLPMRVIEKLFLLGAWMDAEQALEFQFVQRVVPKGGEVRTESRKWAEQAALIPSETFGHSKDQIRRSIELMGLSKLPMALARFGPPSRPADPGDPAAGGFAKDLAEVGLKEAVRRRDEKFDPEVSRV